MAEAFVDTANGISDDEEKREDMIEMIAFKSNALTELSTRSKKPENIIGSQGKGNIKILKIVCVGGWSSGWSKGVFINDYIAGTISENPNNDPVIGVDFSLKDFHVNSNEEVRLQIWNIAEQAKFSSITKIYYKNSKGGIVFWGARSRSMESAIRWKEYISRVEPDIPIILLVDNVFKTPVKWIGEGSVMNSAEEMDTFCSEHGFVAWFEMLERAAGENSVLGQAIATLVNEVVHRISDKPAEPETVGKLKLTNKRGEHSCICS